MKLSLTLLLSAILVVSCAPAADPEPASAPEAEVEAEPVAGTREDPFLGHGFIREIRDDGVLVIEHEEIPGFMMGMTMGFPVAEGVVAEGTLAVDDEINFQIESLTEGYQIFNIEKVEADAEEEMPEEGADPEPSTSD